MLQVLLYGIAEIRSFAGVNLVLLVYDGCFDVRRIDFCFPRGEGKRAVFSTSFRAGRIGVRGFDSSTWSLSGYSGPFFCILFFIELVTEMQIKSFAGMSAHVCHAHILD